MAALTELAPVVGLTAQGLAKIDENDTLRVTNYLALCLALHKSGRSWQDAKQSPVRFDFWSTDDDADQHNENVRKAFLFNSDQIALSEKLDKRVEEMVAN